MEIILKKNLSAKRRRELIPIWMKPFIFLFVLFGISGIYGIGKNIMGFDSNSSLYGLESNTVFSLLGAFLKLIMFFKAIVSFGLWMEKDWAIQLGIIDAVFGIIVCIVVMAVLPFVDFEDGINKLNIRFEILLLIPYLYKLLKMKKEWESLSGISPVISNAKENTSTETFIENTNSVDMHAAVENRVEETINKEDPTRFMPK